MDIIQKFDVQTIRSIISNDFPGLAVESIRLVENGWDNLVAEINQNLIFRFPKRPELKGRFAREVKILNFLEGKISVPIPQISFLGKGFVYMGYKKIPGGDLTREVFDSLSADQKDRLVFDLSNFFREIHDSLTVEGARKMGFEDEDSALYLSMARKALAGKMNDSKVDDFVRQTCDEYEKMTGQAAETVLLYNDLHTENMAFDAKEKRLNGIFDFGDLMTGDVNKDFCQLYKFDPYFMKEVAEKYGESAGRELSLRRMVIYGRINELCDLSEFVDKPESAVYKNAMARIRKWAGEMDLFVY